MLQKLWRDWCRNYNHVPFKTIPKTFKSLIPLKKYQNVKKERKNMEVGTSNSMQKRQWIQRIHLVKNDNFSESVTPKHMYKHLKKTLTKETCLRKVSRCH